jgi:hypothetical protein
MSGMNKRTFGIVVVEAVDSFDALFARSEIKQLNSNSTGGNMLDNDAFKTVSRYEGSFAHALGIYEH